MGKGKSKKSKPVHKLRDILDIDSNYNVIEVLPAIHALSGCDSTSNVGPKFAFLHKPLHISLISGFGQAPIMTILMISNAEKRLLSSLQKSRDVIFLMNTE